MTTELLFVSDLHLSAGQTQSVERFVNFLRRRAAGARALYILGDLFDAYIGDDDLRFPNGRVREGLQAVTASGTAVYFQHGNRDFLVGSGFARHTGVRLLGDYAVIDVHGTSTLVTHGDLLCTDDHQYQAARRRVRAETWKTQALAKPLFLRRWYARWYRYKSGWDKRGKTADIMDVNDGTVVDTIRHYRVTRLIHGHTHRPAVHTVPLGALSGQRFVLSEWTDHGEVLVWTPEGYRHEAVD